MPKRTDIKSILIIGAGPIVIGQACEFDYSGAQACKALREEGYRVILVNSNPATIMTDPEMADVTYIEPITWQTCREDHRQGAPRRAAADHGRPDRAELRAGPGRHGVLEKYGVEMIGAKPRPSTRPRTA
jgi:carbamoyl-phosphate synthase large subunit